MANKTWLFFTETENSEMLKRYTNLPESSRSLLLVDVHEISHHASLYKISLRLHPDLIKRGHDHVNMKVE